METQLKDEFNVRRDKSQLIANDDILDFMAEIANSDNVIIVLTSEYVKSMNCMLEMATLVSQGDWKYRTMILVIDESLYLLEKKIEVINYWQLWQKRNANELYEIGRELYKCEKDQLDIICSQIELFFAEISRRKNPSQIAIVNEVIKKSKRDKRYEIEFINYNEEKVLNFIKQHENTRLRDISDETNLNDATVRRMVSDLAKKGIVTIRDIENEKRYQINFK